MNYRILIATLGVMAMTSAVAAELKLATIDLKRVFDGYYRTKQADAQLKESAADLDKARKGMMEDYEKSKEEFEKLQQAANDQALAAEERDKRKAAAQKKYVELIQIEKDVAQFDRTSRSTLADKQRRMRDRILEQIKEVVNAKAKEKGATMVIDTAAESANQTPVVLYATSDNDITELVLNELNSHTAVDLPVGDTATDKKEPAKEDKK